MSAAIRVESLAKRFRIPLDRSTTLKYRLAHVRSASRYRDLWALRDVSFEIPDGQFVGIIGANGSGKSTLLKILSCIYKPTAGEMRLAGKISPFLELGVGFNPELTARENVYVNGAILGLSRAELERRMEGILSFAELEDFADQKLKNYSSGMQVRLAFTVAIQAEASIFLMDEVLAVGDARFQAKCFEVFARYRRQGRTVVLVTHDLGAVDFHCDRALLFDHGQLVADGPASQVTARYLRQVGESQDGAGSAGEDADQTDRWGNGAIRFQSVQLLDENRRERTSFLTAQPLTLALGLKARDKVEDLVIGIALHRADGLILSGTNTHLDSVALPLVSPGDTVKVEYRLPRLPFVTGTYRLTVAAHPATHAVTYDHFEQAYEFSVTDTRGHAGQFEVGGQWFVE